MATTGERVALLLRIHGDSYRSAAERCNLDHVTIMRIERGEATSPATLAKIAESYGAPVDWVRGEPDLATDFAFSVLLRPLRDRVLCLWEPERRLRFALHFLLGYAPARYALPQLAGILQADESTLVNILEQEQGRLSDVQVERLCNETGIPLDWFRTEMVGREDAEEMLVGLAEWALTSLAETAGLAVTDEEIHQAAVALV